MVKTLLGVLCAAALGWVNAVALAAESNRIEAINVSGQQGGQVVVKITLSQPLANAPAGFSINNPPRIALDLPNTVNALGRTSQDVREGDLRSLNIVQAGGRTRLVMNLARAVGFDYAAGWCCNGSRGWGDRLAVRRIQGGSAEA
jgi:type IV pilus assembly protein PilQ